MVLTMQTTTPTITVYSKPGCVQCTATARELERRNLDFEVVDVSVDDAALQRVMELGYRQAPVVVAGDEHWSGFRPDRIGALALQLA